MERISRMVGKRVCALCGTPMAYAAECPKCLFPLTELKALILIVFFLEDWPFESLAKHRFNAVSKVLGVAASGVRHTLGKFEVRGYVRKKGKKYELLLEGKELIKKLKASSLVDRAVEMRDGYCQFFLDEREKR